MYSKLIAAERRGKAQGLFYCTKNEKQAQKWARTKKGTHIVNVYDYAEDPALQIKRFKEMTDEWLDFIAECRNGKKHVYDVVEGPMANDQVWDYVEDYLRGAISREAFWVLAKFKYPTHQIAFCTETAIQTLQFNKGYEL